jgi:hypothetical protein
MKIRTWCLSLFFLIFSLSFLPMGIAQEVPISEDEMVALINSSYGKTPLYSSKDIPDKDLHTFDFNGDGVAEWVVVPANACGETHNCTFFIMQYEKKKWKLLLMNDGKVTSLTPWGFVVSPRKTKNYSDIITVFDIGPDNAGNRLLERHIYIWDGKKYAEFTGSKYPPDKESPEITALLDQVDKLKFQKMSGPPKKRVVRKKGPKADVYTLPPEQQ